MSTPTPPAEATRETMVTIARLLHHAAGRVTREAARQGPRSALHVFGLGIHVAAAEAALLVPPNLDPYWPPPAQDDPLELLRAADRLAATVPIDQEVAGGFSRVEVMIADLLRETGAIEAGA